jgi:hypothetical protein
MEPAVAIQPSPLRYKDLPVAGWYFRCAALRAAYMAVDDRAVYRTG